MTSIDETERRHLEKLITFDEMSTALSLMKNGKSSGLDGISFEWYKKFWNIIGHDLHDVFLYLIKTGKLLTSCRQGVIMLLPKNGDNGLLKNWRPITPLSCDLFFNYKMSIATIKACTPWYNSCWSNMWYTWETHIWQYCYITWYYWLC